LTAEIAICPVLHTVVMLEMVALGLPLSFSCATALLKLLTAGQYAAVRLVLAGAVLLVPAGARAAGRCRCRAAAGAAAPRHMSTSTTCSATP
jgi:hypothetical protein